MCMLINRAARTVLTIAIMGLLVPMFGADVKPDKKKSQAAFQAGELADRNGKREEAIAAFSEAIQADGTNAAALRARGRDYYSAGESEKAIADLDAAVRVQPGDPASYVVRG